MNVELQNILNQIISEQGDAILSEPKRVSSFLSDLARETPKPQKTALIKSLEHGFPKTLKDVSPLERDMCKQKLAQRLNEEEGLELRLCEEILELLAAVLFGEIQKIKDNPCKNSGKELQIEANEQARHNATVKKGQFWKVIVFVVVATLFNIVVTAICFFTLYMVYVYFLLPLAPGSFTTGFTVLFVVSLALGFLIYRKAIKAYLNKHPIYSQKIRFVYYLPIFLILINILWTIIRECY